MHKTSTTQVRRILVIQLLATILISAICLAFGVLYATSALAGGMIATLGNGYFAWKVFAKQREATAEQILATYYGAEVGKIILTVMLFTAAIVMIKPLSMVTLVVAYVLNYMIPLLVSIFFKDDSENWRVKNVR